MNSYTVYKHIVPNGKVYIGITKKKPKERWNKGLGYIGNNYFYNAILKYGWDNIDHQIILSNVSKSEAIYAEKYLIKWYKIHNISYNIAEGGEGAESVSNETREKLSLHGKTNQGCINGLRKAQEQSKLTVLQVDLKQNQVVREWSSITEAATELGIDSSGISKVCRGKRNMCGGYGWQYKNGQRETDFKTGKAVIQLTLEGDFIREFNSIQEACRFFNKRELHIGDVCNGKRSSCMGYKWKYKNERS